MSQNAPQLLNGPKHGGGGGGGGGSAVKKSPIPTMLLGLWMLSIWFILTMMDIEATEALYTGVKVTSFTPEWSLILQIPQIIAGQPMSVIAAKAAIVAWTLEVCTLTCLVGFDLAMDAVKHANHRLTKVFGSGLIILTIVDVWANYRYGPGGSEILGQILFAIVVAFGGLFFGVPGFRLLEHGFKTWRHHP